MRAVSRKAAAHLHALRDEQHLAALDAVRHHAADQGEQKDRDAAEEGIEAEQKGELESFRTSQLCAAICIQVPMLEVQAPIHIRRKSRY